jgi:hypothetical protein
VAGWVVTGVLTAGAAVVGALALVSSNNLKNQKTQPSTHDDLVAAKTKTVALAGTTDGLIGAAVIAGAVSIYLTVRSPQPATSPTSAREPGSIKVGIGPGSILLAGTF